MMPQRFVSLQRLGRGKGLKYIDEAFLDNLFRRAFFDVVRVKYAM